MAFFRGNIRSKTLEQDIWMEVLLPHDRPVENAPGRVLYLLHGLKQDSSNWVRYSGIEHYARALGLTVIMPQVHRSFYTNMVHGPAYFDFITQELPQLCSQMFRFSARREDTYIAGLSMGGYGALKAALRCPELFAAAGGFSSVADPIPVMLHEDHTPLCRREAPAIWGQNLELAPEDNLFLLAQQAAALPSEQQPLLYSCCGTEDILYQQNQELRQTLEALPLNYRYEQWEGIHDWQFWDEALRRFIRYYIAD